MNDGDASRPGAGFMEKAAMAARTALRERRGVITLNLGIDLDDVVFRVPEEERAVAEVLVARWV